VTSTSRGAFADRLAFTLNGSEAAARQLFGSTPGPEAVTLEGSTSLETGTLNGLPIYQRKIDTNS
jgi:hypothetical protein